MTAKKPVAKKATAKKKKVVAPEVVAPEVVAPEVVAPEVVAPEVVAPEVVAPVKVIKEEKLAAPTPPNNPRSMREVMAYRRALREYEGEVAAVAARKLMRDNPIPHKMVRIISDNGNMVDPDTGVRYSPTVYVDANEVHRSSWLFNQIEAGFLRVVPAKAVAPKAEDKPED